MKPNYKQRCDEIQQRAIATIEKLKHENERLRENIDNLERILEQHDITPDTEEN